MSIQHVGSPHLLFTPPLHTSSSQVVTKSDIGLGESYMDGDFTGDVFKMLLLLSRSNSGSPSALKQATAGGEAWRAQTNLLSTL